MGCDIHAHLEVRLNGKWEHYSVIDIDRSYSLFAIMTGVRNYGEIEPISKPKGLPEDVSQITKIDRMIWDEDGHSDSWLDVIDMEKLRDRIKKTFGNDSIDLERDVFNMHSSFFGCEITDKSSYPEGVDDVRLVFWFDN